MKPGLWLDAPKFVEWMEKEYFLSPGAVEVRLGKAYARRMLDWRKGGKVKIWTVDRMLTRLDHHISELPDELFLDPLPPSPDPFAHTNEPPPPPPPSGDKGEALSPEEKEIIRYAAEAQVPCYLIARHLDRHYGTVHRFLQKHA